MTQQFWTNDPSAVVTALDRAGWVRLADALDDESVSDLIQAIRTPFGLSTEKGMSRRPLFGSYVPLDECERSVQRLASSLTSGLSAATEAQGWPPIPAFNEAMWTLLPSGTNHMTTHRDPKALNSVIAVMILEGAAEFRIHERSTASASTMTPGDILLLAGDGYPRPASKRPPRHELELPAIGDQVVMTMRSIRSGVDPVMQPDHGHLAEV